MDSGWGFFVCVSKNEATTFICNVQCSLVVLCELWMFLSYWLISFGVLSFHKSFAIIHFSHRDFIPISDLESLLLCNQKGSLMWVSWVSSAKWPALGKRAAIFTHTVEFLFSFLHIWSFGRRRQRCKLDLPPVCEKDVSRFIDILLLCFNSGILCKARAWIWSLKLTFLTQWAFVFRVFF